MNGKSSKKKLKMERLSPIPAQGRPHLLEPPHTPVHSRMPTSGRQKDAYAIETTSSPEFGKLPVATGSSLQKPRRYRHIARKTSKTPNSTPLTGLIARKPVATPLEDLHFSDPFSSNSNDVPAPRNDLDAPSQLPQIDEFSPEKPLHSPRHAEIIAASVVFPPKPQPSTSSTTPLAGIVNRRSSNLNRSLNDSIAILQEAEDPSDDEAAPDNCLDIPQSEKISIESFESPRKPRCAPASIFKTFCPYSAKNLAKSNPNNSSYCLLSPVIEKTTSNSEEMCGTERKNRKRALDFNSSMFMAPKNNVNDSREESLPVLSMTLPCREQEGGCKSPGGKPLSPNHGFKGYNLSTVIDSVSGEDGKSPVLDVMLARSPSPVLNLRSCRKLDDDRKSTVLDFPDALGEGSGSPELDLESFIHDRENDSPSPVLNLRSCRKLDDDRQSTVLDLPDALGEGSGSPELDLESFIHDRENDSPSPVLTLSVNRDCEGSPSLSFVCCESAEERKSPILDLPSARIEDVYRPSPNLILPQKQEKDGKSPVLCLLSGDRDHCFSPSVRPANHRSEHDSRLPNLELNPAFQKRENGCPPPTANSLSSFRPLEPNVQPLKPTEAPKLQSPIENQEEECPSDTDSIIESTPSRPKSRNYNSCGFTASSCLKIEDNSPPRPDVKDTHADHSEIPEIEVFEETFNRKTTDRCDLKFVVVSHDSSDESVNHSDEDHAITSRDVILPTIEGHSPELVLNHTRRPIQSFESPSKSAKPFSEAVNIGAFGSPDSNAGHQDEVEDGTSDEVVEPSTTQEYVEESEQVRPTKRRKKGSLLERVRGVMAKVDASNTLFDYELKCGLRPAKGKFVSAPLVVLKTPNENSSVFLVCKPLKYCKNPSNEDISSFVLVHVNKLPLGVSDGSVVLLHFPLNVIYFSHLHVPCVMAGHQIVPHPTEQMMDISTIDVHPLESINCFSLPYSKPLTSFRTFSSVLMRTLSEAALGQNLVEDSNLFLTVLHVTKVHEKAFLKKILVLCCDEESAICWLEFSSERDIKRAVALDTLSILSDGSQIQTKGFSVVDRVRLDRKSKNLIAYCSNNVVNNEIIFSVRPEDAGWVISSTDGFSQSRKIPSKISDILSKKIPGCRYLLEVHGVEKGPNHSVKDSEGQSIDFIVGKNSCLNLEQPVPFFLDAVYFYDGRIFSDEHSKVIPKS